jgi:hypothetical protein
MGGEVVPCIHAVHDGHCCCEICANNGEAHHAVPDEQGEHERVKALLGPEEEFSDHLPPLSLLVRGVLSLVDLLCPEVAGIAVDPGNFLRHLLAHDGEVGREVRLFEQRPSDRPQCLASFDELGELSPTLAQHPHCYIIISLYYIPKINNSQSKSPIFSGALKMQSVYRWGTQQ